MVSGVMPSGPFVRGSSLLHTCPIGVVDDHAQNIRFSRPGFLPGDFAKARAIVFPACGRPDGFCTASGRRLDASERKAIAGLAYAVACTVPVLALEDPATAQYA